MSEQNTLQYAREEAEYLRKRAWDLIDKLEKLERELNKSVDEDKRRSLQIQIDNVKTLLENYKIEYKSMCDEAGIASEIGGTGEADNDASYSSINKTKNEPCIDLPPLFLVPSRDPMFLGRQEEIKEFVQMVLDGGAFAICGFKGMGGIGKTEIAKEVCHFFHETWKKQPDLPENITDLLSQRKFFHDGILWIQFHPEGQTPKTLTDDLISWLIKEYSEASKKSENRDEFAKEKENLDKFAKEKENLNAIKKLNLETLAEALAGKDVLVVLDNVEQNLRTLDYVLERFKGRFTLLITSRIAIPGIKSINLDVLTEEDAEELFLCYMGNQQPAEEERTTVRELCKLLGNYPLLIKIIASQVKADNSKLAELLKKYKENPVQLLNECNDSLCIDQRHIDVRACFMSSFKELTKEEQRVFHNTPDT
ncbi:MAG: hypothetical protein D3906_05035, partial [Candidatus Electrothrix sp. AUS1_2]|nr:hypothetical protein [Candidatus Electrothrix sp. AUS1_2]